MVVRAVKAKLAPTAAPARARKAKREAPRLAAARPVSRREAEAAAAAVDWEALDRRSDRDIARQTASDPDAAPLLSEAESAQGLVLATRKRLGLSQPEFARRYRIPLGTLRDWEQGRVSPDRPAFALVLAIQRDPVTMARLLGD